MVLGLKHILERFRFLLTLEFFLQMKFFAKFSDVFQLMIDPSCSKHFLMKILLYLDNENKPLIVGSRKLQLPWLTEGTASNVL